MYYGNIDIVYIIWVKNVYKVKLRNFGAKHIKSKATNLT